ncbi:MAG: glycosyltransferase family 39 protein [Cyclobacteriaceae bacterium]
MPVKHLLIIFGWTLLIHLPFIDQPYHIDDPLFYHLGNQIAEGNNAYEYKINWASYDKRLLDFFSNPPGIGYFIALVINFLGDSERAFHLSYMVFTVLAAVSCYFFALYFKCPPLISSLLLISTPMYMVMAHTIMPDIALLAFYLFTVTLFLWGLKNESKRLLLLSGISAGLAIMFRYNGLSILPLLGLLLFLNPDKFNRWSFAAIVIPFGIFIFWNFYSFAIYGNSHFLHQWRFQNSFEADETNKWIAFFISNAGYLSSATVFPLIFLLPIKFFKNVRLTLIGVVGMVVLIYSLFIQDRASYTLLHAIMVITFMSCWGFFTVVVLRDLISQLKAYHVDRDLIFLICWIGGVMVLHTTGIHTAAKYMLPALPPLIILLHKYGFAKIKGTHQAMALFATLFVAFLISRADYQLAMLNKEMVSFSKSQMDLDGESNVYFTGHWGFQYYMEAEGFEAYEFKEDRLKHGDYMVTSSLSYPQGIKWDQKVGLEFLAEKKFKTSFGLRSMNAEKGRHANFYSYRPKQYGVLPFTLSENYIDTLTVYRRKPIQP